MRHWVGVAIFGLILAASQPARANPEMVRNLGDVLQMDKTLAIMSQEAVANATEVAPDLFGGTSPDQWATAVAKLFDPVTARSAFDAGLLPAVTAANQQDLAQALAYFDTPMGQRMLDLELSAREALLDDDVEAAAKQTWADLLADPMPASAQRVQLIREIVAATDLIESNVSSAMNGNFAFFQGLAEAGGFAAEMTEEDMLAEVRSQEGELRSDTADWLFPFLAMAYAPLSDDDLRGYIAFSKSPAGQALNGVLFMAFDEMGMAQSRGMGLAAGRLMVGQDI
jgi:hypothetical protein